MASSQLYSFCFIFHVITIVSAQTSNLTIGTIISPIVQLTPQLVSPSGDFASSFRALENDSSLFLLAIWFNKIPNNTVTWTANRDEPVSSSSVAELTSEGQFSLRDSTNRDIWNANVSNASHGSMLDNGNFVLAMSDGKIIWRSFDYPTDTILPGQVLKQGFRMFSCILEDDYSKGRFDLRFQVDGNLVMYSLAYPTEWEYNDYWSTKTSGSGINLVFNESGSIYLLFRNRSTYPVMVPTMVLTDDYYQPATLDPDGVFRHYSFLKQSSSTGEWVVKQAVPSDICSKLLESTGSGACGFNSFCNNLTPDGKPSCQCAPHYSFLDPERKYKGCKPDFIFQNCDRGGEAPFSLTEIINIDWPLSDSEKFYPMDMTECTDNCLKDCFCYFAVYSNMSCWKKKYPLSNGIVSSSVNRQTFVKFSSLNHQSPPLLPPYLIEEKEHKSQFVVESVILGGSIFLNLVLIGTCFAHHRYKKMSRPAASSTIVGPTLCSFTYKELQEATKGFSEEIGKGTFGTVYKGVLPSQPSTLIAVKKLENLSEESERDFANEVATIGQTHQENLVQLLGFCKEGMHQLMVFEFMSNGSLNTFLFGHDHPGWNQRVQIAIGTATGLAYLHEECRTQIIHCDIKPQNILLDENLEARISDFGLAKLLKLHQTRTSTGIRGTIGYCWKYYTNNLH